jgi:hypothetical protein
MSIYKGFFDGSEKTSEDFLKKVLLENGSQILEYNQMTNIEKTSVTSDVINKALNFIRRKEEVIDYTFVERSAGDIEKLTFYKDLESSIFLLNNLYQKSNGTGPKYIPQLMECLMNMKRFRPNFVKGFQDKNQLIEILYNNVTISLISATSYAIASSVDYTRDSLNLWNISLRKDLKNNKNFFNNNDKNTMNLHTSNIEKFNEYCVKGYILNYINKSGSISIQNGVQSNLVGEIMIGIGLILAVLFFLQQIIYLWFYLRKYFALQLKILANFVQLHAATIGPKLADVRTRQEAIVKELNDLADKIDVGTKVAERSAGQDLNDDTKTIVEKNTTTNTGGIL